MIGEVAKLNVLGDALDGFRGPDQQRIAATGLDWTHLLLCKNADYGSSVWKSPMLAPECSVDAAIRVRMTDKIERLRHILEVHSMDVAESLDDTVRDLGAYCLLWLARPKEEQAVKGGSDGPGTD